MVFYYMTLLENLIRINNEKDKIKFLSVTMIFLITIQLFPSHDFLNSETALKNSSIDPIWFKIYAKEYIENTNKFNFPIINKFLYDNRFNLFISKSEWIEYFNKNIMKEEVDNYLENFKKNSYKKLIDNYLEDENIIYI